MAITRILLTGAAGFIGSNVLMRLANNSQVIVWALDIKDDYSHLPSYVSGASNIITICGDAGDCAELCAAKRFDYIIHLAGSAGVRESDANPLHYLDNNVRVTSHLFEQARLTGVRRVVYASSSSVYGDAPTPHMDYPDSAANAKPASIYALTKRMCEDVAKFYHSRHGVRSIGLRFFTVYGPFGRTTMAVNGFIAAMLKGEPITIFGEGEQSRDYTYVHDVVTAIMHCTKADDNVTCDVFNVGHGNTCSVLRLVALLRKEIGAPSEGTVVVHAPRHAADVEATLANCDRLYEILKFRPRIPLEIGLAATVQWQQEKNTSLPL